MGRFGLRRWILVALTLGIFGIFVARLINVQIVRVDELLKELEVGSTSKQTVRATRGEIVDRNGTPMISNKLGYDVVIDKVAFPSSERNEIILRLIGLFEKDGAEWIDNLPITAQEPFAFLEGHDAEQLRLKEHLQVAQYATVEDTLFHLTERYKLQDYPADDARRIMGVRYEMEQRGFEINVPYTFASDIEIGLGLKIKEHSYQLSGVDVQESALRSYDMSHIAPHLVGRVGPIYREELDAYTAKGYAMDDIVGKSGAELAFEDLLRGTKGERIISLDSRNRVIDAVETTPPVPGNTVYLTLDWELQELLQQALEAQIKYLQTSAPPGQGREATYGAAVVINNKTGELLACATYPSFDQNTYPQDYAALVKDEDGKPLYNRALQGLYAPGSTFKPVVGTAALASGVATEHSTVHCGMIYTRFFDYQPKCLSAHGSISLNRALSQSCNIYFYDMGWNTGIEVFDEYARQYGLGEPTGIELTEQIGQRSNPETFEAGSSESWSNGNVLQSAIGQLVARYTPLQMANYAATIANRGDRMKVTVVHEVRDYSRESVIQPAQPEVVERVQASREDMEAVVRGMITASRYGSAVRHFGTYPFDVASKTGTPETSIGQHPNSTFICFGPAEDPEIAIAVVIEQGWHGYTSAPVARAVMDYYFNVPNANPLVRPNSTETPTDAERAQAAASGGSSDSQDTPAQPEGDADESTGEPDSGDQNTPEENGEE